MTLEFYHRIVQEYLSELSLLKDLAMQENNDYMAQCVVVYYFCIRRGQSNGIQEFHRMFLEHSDILFAKNALLDENVHHVLCSKSSLHYMALDYPEIAENLMYSPFMNQLDDVIDSWSTVDSPFNHYAQLLEARKLSKGLRTYVNDAEELLMLAKEAETAAQLALEETSASSFNLRREAESQQWIKESSVIKHAKMAADRAFILCEKAQNHRIKAKNELEHLEFELNQYESIWAAAYVEYDQQSRYLY